MDKHNKILDNVSLKTHVSKQDILSLANDLQHKDLKNEDNIREFIKKVSKVAQKDISSQQMEKLVSIIKNNKVPQDIEKLV